MSRLTAPLLLFILTLSLFTIGIVSIFSAGTSTSLLLKQIMFACACQGLMLACPAVDYNLLKRHSFKLMVAALFLCGLVFVPGIGWSGNRFAHRWINLGPLRFQPSEFAKLALVIYMAMMLSERHQSGYIKSFFSGVLPAMIITGLFAVVIVLEPDFGAAFVL